ncbi:hypothetical protein AX17_000778 [Amanita inopinata Kibby_2008]|nr:hypothetical protein AX17_000778 [Amanita inopinata Kibby_2008]
MAPKRESPNRRRSIAVPDQNKPAFISRSKRRAHSIVSGDRLSPLARARRSLAPRKSILKASINNISVNGSQQGSSQAFNPDDPNATQSMDITTDFHAQDNTTRKSIGRRVSFAAHARVRLFEKANNDNTNSTGTPPSSPGSADSPGPPYQEQAAPQFNDENNYPGARSHNRRNSVRYSMALSEGEDMDLTSVGPSAFGGTALDESAVLDEEFDEAGSLDDMEITEAINGALIRRRSLATGLSRLPEEDEIQSQTTDVERSREQDMEFTIPLSRSLRPAHHDEAWLALRNMTHSGSENVYEPEPDPELSEQPISFGDNAEDSFNDEDSYHGIHDGNETMNISKLLGWPSEMDDRGPRLSIGYQESNMDESEVYGSVTPAMPGTTSQELQADQTSQSSIAAAPLDPQPLQTTIRPSVFQPPPKDVPPPSVLLPRIGDEPIQDAFPLQTPQPFTFTAPRSPAKTVAPSPSKIPVSKPTFTAAFAPPIARPTPKKSATNVLPSEPVSSKRSRQAEDDGYFGEANMSIDLPSPAKRQAMANKWPVGGGTPTHVSASPSSSNSLPRPRPLSPSKKAPFQGPSTASNSTTRTTSRTTSSLRRPSGYFARRKSLAPGSNFKRRGEANNTTNPRNDGGDITQSSAGTKVGLGFRRASVGSGSVDAWKRFDKTLLPQETGSGSQSPTRNIGGASSNNQISSLPSIPQSPSSPLTQAVPETGTTYIASNVLQHDNDLPARAADSGFSPEDQGDGPAETWPHMQTPTSVDLSGLLGVPGMEEDVDVEADKEQVPVGADTDITTEQWLDSIKTQVSVNGEIPQISIEQFFDLTGIRFMDELTAPRRSTHPSQHHPTRQAREASEISRAEYYAAMAIHIPQLELYTRVSRDLQAWIEQSRIVYAQAEEEAAKMTPELFAEYSKADEEGQAELLHQLNLIRTNVRGQAKSDWYDWKLQWVDGLREIAGNAFTALEADAKMLESVKNKADEVVPGLEREYEEIMRELEHERAEVAEIEASDQEYLNELKATISEQNIEVEALQAEVAEGKSRLQWLQERLEELEIQKQEATNTIADAHRILRIQKNSTRAEVFKLKDELEALEDLHMFHATRVGPDLFRYIYASQFEVTIPCHNHIPIVTQVDVTRLEGLRMRYKDEFPELSDFFLSMAKQQIAEGEDLTVRQIVHRLGDYWSSCTQLRSQLKLLSIKYPVEIEIVRPTNGEGLPTCKAHTTIMYPAVKAKAILSFVFSTATFCFWPLTLDSLDCDVQVAYGPIDRSSILKRVIDRLSQATPSDNYACLLDACIE